MNTNRNRLALFVLIIFFIPSIVHAKTVRLGWTEEQHQLWQRMSQENHPYWRTLSTEAGAPGNARPYFDRGLREGMLYLITGDKHYAQRAYHRYASKWCGRSYNPRPNDPEWCATNWRGKITRDGAREDFIRLARLYSWIADALNPHDKNNFRDILELWTDLVFSDQKTFGVRLRDSDQAVGNYFGVVIFALAISEEDPKRSKEILEFAGSQGSEPTKPLGGLDSTGENILTWRNSLSYFAHRARGGQWLESTNYNLGTLRLLVAGTEAVNAIYEEDKFPEITALYQDLSDGLVQELTPMLNDSFQWGDEQQPHDIYAYSRAATLAVLGGVAKNPETLYAFDHIYRPGQNIVEDVFLFLNPYIERKAPNGRRAMNAEGRGIAYYHHNWTPRDSFFASQFTNQVGVDHSMGTLSNFALFRNGYWVIDFPRGYYGHWDHDAPYQNTLLVSGAFSEMREAKGQSAYEAGDGYLYHAGLTAGQYQWNGLGRPIPEILHEWNRSHLYLHNDDNTDTIFVFDRLNNTDPTDPEQFDPAMLERIPKINLRQRLNGSDGYHHFITHMDSVPQVAGNIIRWRAPGGQDVYWHTFVKDFKGEVFSDANHIKQGYPYYLNGYNIESRGVTYRLIPQQKSGFQTLFNVFHVGSVPNIQELNVVDGERAQGAYLRDQNVMAIFNGQENVPPAPTPFKNEMAAHNFDRFEQTKQLRYFQQGFQMDVQVFDVTKVYIVDLDPMIEWSGTVAEQTLPLDVSDQGVAVITIPAGEQSILIAAGKKSKKSAAKKSSEAEAKPLGVLWIMMIVIVIGALIMSRVKKHLHRMK